MNIDDRGKGEKKRKEKQNKKIIIKNGEEGPIAFYPVNSSKTKLLKTQEPALSFSAKYLSAIAA